MTQVVGKTTQNIRSKYSDTSERQYAFAVGFATGQAEKVHLGVCRAAMFRPSKELFEWYLGEVKQIAENYSLQVSVLACDNSETPFEIWIHNGPIGEWLSFEINSPDWHRARAKACGIPEDKVDVNYHLKSGYGKRCD